MAVPLCGENMPKELHKPNWRNEHTYVLPLKSCILLLEKIYEHKFPRQLRWRVKLKIDNDFLSVLFNFTDHFPIISW